ncbi:hypothetical protein [Neobacillus vireti]|uniref:hypothetical protein n=1 Tax=Neobacillus vireti TaxID=220686 RepID=UPI002FFFEB22
MDPSQKNLEQAVVTKTKVPSQKRNLNWLDKLIRSKNIEPLDTNRKVVFSWSIWGCALGYFLLVGIQYSIMTWVPTYLVMLKGFLP